MLFIDLIEQAANPSSGSNELTTIVIGVLSVASSLGVAYFAFRGKKVNPLENGASFIATEARALAEFHREDAERVRAEMREITEELNGVRAQLAEAIRGDTP